MYKHIAFNESLSGLGRNGTFKCQGVEVIKSALNNNYITLTAQTSRGFSNSCWFEVPVEKIDELIEALKKAKEGE